MNLKNKAIELADKGLCVFPLKPNKKEPAISGWQDKSTTDKNLIEKWWGGLNCTRNIGIDTEKSGLCVIDIDTKGKNGKENYDELIEKYGENKTWTVQTPSNGFHLYYDSPYEELKSTVSKIAEGVDTRASGGYVVAPGSFINDLEYKVIDKRHIQPCPKWIIPRVERKEKPKLNKNNVIASLDAEVDCLFATELLKEAKTAIQGEGGDQATYELCCELHDRGISVGKGVELLAEHWNERCEPPWSIEELNTKMSNAYDFAQSAPGCKSIRFSSIKSKPKKVHNAAEMSIDIPPRDWIIEGRLIAGYVSVTIAPGGLGKSMFTMLEAVSIATGKALTGQEPRKTGPVLIYNTEDPQDEIERRLLAICQHYNIDVKELNNVYYASGVESPLKFAVSDRTGAIVTKDRDILKEIIEENGIILTIFDPFVRTHSVDENSNVDIDLVVQQMSSLAIETKSAISVVHHTNKQSKSGADSARGASSLSSAARIVSSIVEPTEEEAEAKQIPATAISSYMKLECSKGNMTAPNTNTIWFKKESTTLPNGDDVGIVELYEADDIIKEKPKFEPAIENELIEIISFYMGTGPIITDEIISMLPDVMPSQFGGMTAGAAKNKFVNLFKEEQKSQLFSIKADEELTIIKEK